MKFLQNSFTFIISQISCRHYLDVYHTFNEDYSHIGRPHKIERFNDIPYNREYYQYVKENPEVINGGKDRLLSPLNQSTMAKDFRNEARIGRLKKYCKENPNDEMANHFYNEYYLKSDMVPKEVKAKCAEINEEFGTKIFLSSDHSEDVGVLNYIKQELMEWENVSCGTAKKLTVLDFSTLKRSYIDNESTYGQSCSAGFAERLKRAISINNASLFQVKHVLRHEITHINDTKRGFNIPVKYNLDEIMPTKENEKCKMVPDFENCKYKEEFYNAGIPVYDVPYAYNNAEEFIAVASEGDMSKYSSEFKQMLVDFGMPEWMFEMRHSDNIEKVAIFNTVIDKRFNKFDKE